MDGTTVDISHSTGYVLACENFGCDVYLISGRFIFTSARELQRIIRVLFRTVPIV